MAQKERRADATATLHSLSDSFRELAERVNPAVVTITAIGYRPAGEDSESDPEVSIRRSTASGVIVDPGGLVVTNAHAVAGAERVSVLLSAPGSPPHRRQSGRTRSKSVKADIIGVDLESDLALLKLNETGLPWLPLGDSDQVQQGQIVLAFGSPLGLDNSMSMGVVSAPARQLRPDDPMIYIQTDAPINPGNSGGPLVNTAGEVVGINTMILSQGGGNEGIGFAIPSNIVKIVTAHFKLRGRVIRRSLGANVQTITPILAAGLQLPRAWGVILSDVEEEGPADRAGLQPGDILLSWNGNPLADARQLLLNLYLPETPDFVQLEVLRGTKTLAVNLALEEKPKDPGSLAMLYTTHDALVPELGVFVIDLNPELREMLTPLRKDTGVLVVARSIDAPLGEEGFRTGDVVYSINRQPVPDLKTLHSIVRKLKPGDAVVGEVERQGRILYVAFEAP